MAKIVLAAFAAVLSVAGCGGPKAEVNKRSVEAIADLQDCWGTNFIKALLVFREGAIDGPQPCLDYQA